MSSRPTLGYKVILCLREGRRPEGEGGGGGEAHMIVLAGLVQARRGYGHPSGHYLRQLLSALPGE